MREDMSKVVIERPREGHGLPSRKTRLRIRRYDPDKEYDDLPSRVSGSRSKYIRPREIKDFSDLLGPLRRFLRKNVGRPWNLVYSEMKEILDDRKVTGRHVFEHVEMEVETHALNGPGLLMELAIKGYDAGSTPAHQIANLRACSSTSRMLRGRQSWVGSPAFRRRFWIAEPGRLKAGRQTPPFSEKL